MPPTIGAGLIDKVLIYEELWSLPRVRPPFSHPHPPGISRRSRRHLPPRAPLNPESCFLALAVHPTFATATRSLDSAFVRTCEMRDSVSPSTFAISCSFSSS